MTYYDTLDDDMKRAKDILVRGKNPPATIGGQGTEFMDMGGTIYGADTYAAYKLLESFVQHIERTTRNATEQLNNLVDALKVCDECGADPCVTADEPHILCAKCRQRETDLKASLEAAASKVLTDADLIAELERETKHLKQLVEVESKAAAHWMQEANQEHNDNYRLQAEIDRLTALVGGKWFTAEERLALNINIIDMHREVKRLTELVADLQRCSLHGDQLLPTSCKSCARIAAAAHEKAQALQPPQTDARVEPFVAAQQDINEGCIIKDVAFDQAARNRLLYLDGKGDTHRTPEENEELKALTTPEQPTVLKQLTCKRCGCPIGDGLLCSFGCDLDGMVRNPEDMEIRVYTLTGTEPVPPQS